MSNQLANPLQSLVDDAAQMLPVNTGETDRFAERVTPQNPGAGNVILCDVSASMAESAGSKTKIAHLREALQNVWHPEHRVFAFSSGVTPIPCAADVPDPSGGTAMDLALQQSTEQNPKATLVISDGLPNDPIATLEVAKLVPGIINVIYCGPETDKGAIEFMRQLARTGCGRVVTQQFGEPKALPMAKNIQRLLT